MANRPQSDAQKALREQAQLVVDKTLEILLAKEDDISWEGFGLIGRLLDFHGMPPKPSGYFEVCKMPQRVDRMRDWPDDYRRAFTLMKKLSENQRCALGYDRARRGRQIAVAHDPFRGPLIIDYDDALCAHELGCTVSQFRSRVYDGYKRLERLIEGVTRD